MTLLIVRITQLLFIILYPIASDGITVTDVLLACILLELVYKTENK